MLVYILGEGMVGPLKPLCASLLLTPPHTCAVSTMMANWILYQRPSTMVIFSCECDISSVPNAYANLVVFKYPSILAHEPFLHCPKK